MLEIRDLCFGYTPDRPILKNVSFSCPPGSCTAILGNNGCGTTTLVKLIDRILIPGSGQVLLEGRDLRTVDRREMARRIAYVAQSQRPGLDTVFDAVLLGRKPFIQVRATEHDYRVT